MKKEKIVAVVLAGGRGKRMKADMPKQYMNLEGYPVLYYSLKQFEQSQVDEIVLVVGKGEESYCRDEIIKRFQLKKVTTIVEGGSERYESVYRALCCIKECDYVLIHDGARPMINQKIIKDSIEGVKKYKACIIGMPVKDTIKIVDENTYAKETPNRNLIWSVQTPQSFQFEEIREAYEKMMLLGDITITDDAMVMEKYTNRSIKLIEGMYENIKITTPEDLIIASSFLRKGE